MLLKAKNCVRCGIKFTTGLDVHAEHKPKNAAAINEYVTWCGDCYPQKNMPIPDGYRKSPTGLVKNVVTGDDRERESHPDSDGEPLPVEAVLGEPLGLGKSRKEKDRNK